MSISISRLALGLLLAVQFVVFERAVLARGRFSSVPGGTLLVAVLGLIVYGSAIAFVIKRTPRWRIPGALALVAAVLMTARFHLPAVVSTMRRPDESPTGLIAFLRELSAAQEQYRLVNRSYAPSVDSLHKWTAPPATATVRIERRDSSAWSARATLENAECAIWVRDSSTRTAAWHREGLPTCGEENPRAEYASTTVIVPSHRERGFTDADVTGEWLQHRVDAQHRGTTSAIAPAGAQWTYALAGELRASAAVAGNQVFIGAHGNGEFVALTLDSGRVGYRIRLPNWVHHEPVVVGKFLIVPFGNSEPVSAGGPQLGSPPSGIAVFDRRTGIERWRRYTSTSVMVSPVVRDSMIATVTHEGDAIAWRIRDGKELWRTKLTQRSPMANPLLADTIMYVGVELAGLCALDVRNGRLLFCNELAKNGWGSGHSSPTLAGNSVLIGYHTRTIGFWLRALVGIAEPTTHGDAVLISADAATGRERWRVNLGRGIHEVVGHIAGTPVVVGSVAYVNAPSSGRIVAIETESGRVIWTTDVRPARGSVLVTDGAVLSASVDGEFLVLDASTGAIRCRQKLPARSDRAGLTLAGRTGILTLRNGIVLARPIGDWLACRAQI